LQNNAKTEVDRDTVPAKIVGWKETRNENSLTVLEGGKRKKLKQSEGSCR